MDQSALETWLAGKVRTLSSVLSASDYTEAVDSAEEELGWTLPETSTNKLVWLKSRSIRHLLFSLMIENAHKFKFEQINLNQRFEHYEAVIKRMDSEFEKAKKENAALFAGVSAYKLFGTKVDAGFSYDPLGRDTTYKSEQVVIHNPTESES
jgi:hypothetical protein